MTDITNRDRWGLMVKFEEGTPLVYKNRVPTAQPLKDQPHCYRSFWQPEGKVTVMNKNLKVTLFEDGRMEVEPHPQMVNKHGLSDGKDALKIYNEFKKG